MSRNPELDRWSKSNRRSKITLLLFLLLFHVSLPFFFMSLPPKIVSFFTFFFFFLILLPFLYEVFNAFIYEILEGDWDGVTNRYYRK